MSSKILNPLARDTANQINSTLDMLQSKSLTIICNLVGGLDLTRQECQLTWRNHCSSRANSGASFTKLAQYRHILNTNSYHCLLFDGSIIRVNYVFSNNILITQNLLWWPAPYNYGDMLIDGYSPIELIDDFFKDSKWYEAINMRTPIRVDFDNTNNTVLHPRFHMHLQNNNSRLVIQEPICFNRFVEFIFRNFYPEYSLKFSDFDYIKYKISSFEEINYRASKIVL